jgi:ferrochelatase
MRSWAAARPAAGDARSRPRALEAVLAEAMPGAETKCFIAMRYWKPLTDETAKDVKAFAPDEVVLLPLYPHYSTTTTGSSLKAWNEGLSRSGPDPRDLLLSDQRRLDRGPRRLIRETYDKGRQSQAGAPAVLGPRACRRKVILAGDPYQKQIEATAAAVAARLGEGWDWKVCYQSRVGPMKWIGPSTDDEIRAAISKAWGVVVTPIAFVSEHIETLVELDHEYRRAGVENGCPAYIRVAALGVEPGFIAVWPRRSSRPWPRAVFLRPAPGAAAAT